MQKFMPLLFEVWKEACRHIEIRESVERMAPVLTRRLPVDLLLVRRLNLERASIDTVAQRAYASRRMRRWRRCSVTLVTCVR